MKIKSLIAWSLLIAGPAALLATPETDRRIEVAARASYNYRTVLEDQVKVKASDGVVTLSGNVQDKGDRDLAADTVENLPGVTEVRNEIVVKPAQEERSDAWIALKIRSRLLVKANVSAGTTSVAVQDGVVVLSGTAENAAQKELTGIYAGEIDGVKSVRNDLAVMPSPKGATMAEKIDDASITSQLKFALLANKATSALKTKVSTADGVITVTGEATSEAQKSLVGKLGQDVRGVKSVRNEMSVKS